MHQHRKIKSVLVTGGSGFLGGHLVSLLTNTYSETTVVSVDTRLPVVIDSIPYGQRVNSLSILENARPKLITFLVDIRDHELMGELFDEFKFDNVIHFAAETGVERSMDCTRPYVSTNVLGTHVLLELSRKFDAHFHYVSTGLVYGKTNPDNLPSEESSTFPASLYASTKLHGEILALTYYRAYGLDVTISRCCNVYGPFQSDVELIPRLIRCIKHRDSILEPQEFPVGKDTLNQWIYVSDCCRIIELIIRHARSGSVFNIGSGVVLSNYELFERISKMCKELYSIGEDLESLVKFQEKRPVYDSSNCVDFNLIRNLLSSLAYTEFNSGLKLTIQHFWDKFSDEGLPGSCRRDQESN